MWAVQPVQPVSSAARQQLGGRSAPPASASGLLTAAPRLTSTWPPSHRQQARRILGPKGYKKGTLK